jgi:calcium-dependent protein kinase
MSKYEFSELEIFKQIHEEGVIHKDLKPENFMIQNQDDDSTVKITDVALDSILGATLHRHNIIASAQSCGKYFSSDFIEKI